MGAHLQQQQQQPHQQQYSQEQEQEQEQPYTQSYEQQSYGYDQSNWYDGPKSPPKFASIEEETAALQSSAVAAARGIKPPPRGK
jgi:hypothetical protein